MATKTIKVCDYCDGEDNVRTIKGLIWLVDKGSDPLIGDFDLREHAGQPYEEKLYHTRDLCKHCLKKLERLLQCKQF